jgi:hypothetical protein
MIIRWPWFLLALALLGPPPVFSSEIKRVVLSARRNATLKVASLARPWQNWVDLVRASLGTLVLTELAFLPGLAKNAEKRLVLFQAACLAVVLLFQVMRVDTKTSRPEQRLQLLAPVFYLCGLTLVLSGLSGVFAVFVGWMFALSSQNPAYQLPVMGVALMAGGYVFGLSLAWMSNVALIFIPFFGAFVLRKRLVFVGTEHRFSSSVLKVS